MRDDSEPLNLCLRDKHSVEGIAMIGRKGACRENMLQCDRERFHPVVVEARWYIHGGCGGQAQFT